MFIKINSFVLFNTSLMFCTSGLYNCFHQPPKNHLWYLVNDNEVCLRSSTIFSRIRVAQSLVFCVVFCRSLLVLYFGHCIDCPSSTQWLLTIPFATSNFSSSEINLVKKMFKKKSVTNRTLSSFFYCQLFLHQLIEHF
jgi:hypothetical protein